MSQEVQQKLAELKKQASELESSLHQSLVEEAKALETAKVAECQHLVGKSFIWGGITWADEKNSGVFKVTGVYPGGFTGADTFYVRIGGIHITLSTPSKRSPLRNFGVTAEHTAKQMVFKRVQGKWELAGDAMYLEAEAKGPDPQLIFDQLVATATQVQQFVKVK